MCENGVAEYRVRQTRQHCGLHYSHDFTGFDTDHRKPEDAVVASDESFHEPLRFVRRLNPCIRHRRRKHLENFG